MQQSQMGVRQGQQVVLRPSICLRIGTIPPGAQKLGRAAVDGRGCGARADGVRQARAGLAIVRAKRAEAANASYACASVQH